MEPKTKTQKKIAELSTQLPEITDKHRSYAADRCFKKIATKCRKTMYCMECGQSWKAGNHLHDAVVGVTCEKCGCHLTLQPTYQKRERSYMAILTTKGGYQVIRILLVVKNMKRSKACHVQAWECMQHWVDSKGNATSMMMKVMGLSVYFDLFVTDSKLEFRNNSDGYFNRKYINPDVVYRQKQILPELKRNGYKNSFHGITPVLLFEKILLLPQCETLLKSGQYSLLRNYRDARWPQMRICIRNRYVVTAADIWYDHLDLLELMGKDILNPKYICPENLNEEHARLNEQYRKTQSRKDAVEREKCMIEDDKKFQEAKRKFFDLLFQDHELTIRPLASVHEFKDEGEIMEHCVFSNKYYEKNESLILTARKENKPLETIEVDLRNRTIVQARGHNNKATEYHERIVNLVTNNMAQIALRV